MAILQGLFVGVTLFKKRQDYKQPIFWLFMGCIASVVLFAIGDDEHNLLVGSSNWFFFHEPLLITFFFLFVRYSGADRSTFDKTDVLFFLPYLAYIVVESLDDVPYFEDDWLLEVLDEIIEFSFLGMLLYCIYDILKNRKEKWLLVFIIPIALVLVIDEGAKQFLDIQYSFLDIDSYGVFLIAILLFYFVTYRLIIAPKAILASANHKYKASNLSPSEVESTIQSLNRLMMEQQLFKNQKLQVGEVATQLGISRQQLSEILNVHMGIRFQDFLNQHRVEAFIECLQQERYQNYTLLGIATEVGFSSKSSFNSTFKKLKGVTPSQYRKREI